MRTHMIHQKPKASRQYRVEEPGTLLPFLLTAVGDKSRNTVKGLLTRGQVQVDGKTGYMMARYVKVNAATVSATLMNPNGNSIVNFRSAPSLNAKVRGPGRRGNCPFLFFGRTSTSWWWTSPQGFCPWPATRKRCAPPTGR